MSTDPPRRPLAGLPLAVLSGLLSVLAGGEAETFTCYLTYFDWSLKRWTGARWGGTSKLLRHGCTEFV